MKHEEGGFRNAAGANIYYQCWLPDQTPKACLLVVHGLGEHSGRYTNLVDYFVPRGFAIYGLDHYGHGRSDGQRMFVDRYPTFTADLKQFLGMVRERQPEHPVFLYGHSMGGLITASFLLDHQDLVDGAVFSGPSVKISPDISAVTIAVGKLLSNILPKAGILALDSDGVSRDPAVVAAYDSDPLVYRGKITARLAAELLKETERVNREASRITLPVMIVQGAEDKLVDPESGPLLNGLIRSESKTLKVYDGLYHEVHNEPEKAMVLADVEMWLETRLAA